MRHWKASFKTFPNVNFPTPSVFNTWKKPWQRVKNILKWSLCYYNSEREPPLWSGLYACWPDKLTTSSLQKAIFECPWLSTNEELELVLLCCCTIYSNPSVPTLNVCSDSLTIFLATLWTTRCYLDWLNGILVRVKHERFSQVGSPSGNRRRLILRSIFVQTVRSTRNHLSSIEDFVGSTYHRLVRISRTD